MKYRTNKTYRNSSTYRGSNVVWAESSASNPSLTKVNPVSSTWTKRNPNNESWS